MKYIKQLDEEILIEKAARILFQELGPVGALRLMTMAPRIKFVFVGGGVDFDSNRHNRNR